MEQDRRTARLLEFESEIRSVFGTPVYVFWEEDIRENYRRLRSTLDQHYPDAVVHFAVKANFNPAVLSILRDEGCSAEVYAGGELDAAMQAGFEPDDCLVTGMNRSPEHIRRALEAGIERFLVDNGDELDRLVAVADETWRHPQVLVRCNPVLDVPTHPEVATATRETKFGLDIESGRAMSVTERVVESDAVDLAGIQLHVGSQVNGIEPYEEAARAMCEFRGQIHDRLGVEVEVVDLGGGFPIQYDEPVPEVEAIIERIAETVQDETGPELSDPTLFFEPGRRLVGNSGTLVGTVGVVKETPYATFAVLDVGTNAISSYWSYPIEALSNRDATERYHVAGPLCYSGDVIAEDVTLPPLSVGDTLAIDRIGAYSLGSASHTNATPKPPILLVREHGAVETIREPERTEDITENARIPDDLG